MRVLFTIRFYPVYGGGETVTLRLADKFVELGHEVYIFYLWDNGQQAVNKKIHVNKIENIHQPIGSEGIRKADNVLIYSQLKEYINNNRIEYVINQWLDPKGVYLAADGKAKVMHCRHAAVYINSRKWNLARKLLGKNFFDKILAIKYKPYIASGDKFILLCEEYAKEMKHIYCGRYDNKIISMLNPCRFDIEETDYCNKENAICYVGRLYPEKQVDLLIKAWKQIEETIIKRDWKFYVVGTGESLEPLKELVYNLKCKNIYFEGYQMPIEYYRKSKIFVSASATEGYPMTIVEAMAYRGVPVIANTYSALQDILPEDINGIKINDVNVYNFAQQLKLLIENEKLLKEKSNRASKFCKEKFDIDKVAYEWCRLFEEINNV